MNTVPRRRVRIGTRASPLARWQAGWVADRLREHAPHLAVELVELRTHGDRDRNTPLAQLGGTGLFTKEIQNALLEGTVEIAVHSLKDLPTQGPPALVLAAVPAREDLADALIAPAYRTLDRLPLGATVGTGSPRRRAQLLHLRPDLHFVSLRGNVETRLRQAAEGRLDAVVLAVAGLKRLGLDRQITERLDPPRLLPAVGQGALGIECRADDQATHDLLRRLDDPDSHAAVLAERAVLATLRGGCTLPLGAWGRRLHHGLALDAALLDPEGHKRLAVSLVGPLDQPEALGRLAGQALLDRGGGTIVSTPATPLPE